VGFIGFILADSTDECKNLTKIHDGERAEMDECGNNWRVKEHIFLSGGKEKPHGFPCGTHSHSACFFFRKTKNLLNK
jgi:hypothetical protein